MGTGRTRGALAESEELKASDGGLDEEQEVELLGEEEGLLMFRKKTSGARWGICC